MGKKSKRHAAHAGAAKPAAGSLINNRTVCKVVEELWARTQGQASSNLASLWKEYDEIVALTDSLKEKQGQSPSHLSPREEGFEAFYDWLKQHNAEYDKVEIGSFGGVGYGIKAKDDIEMGERVMRIPEKLMMTSETAKASQLGSLIARDRMLQVMPNVALALHLLNERYNPKSFWKPYIDVLPSTFSLPLWFSKSQLEMLQGSPCLSDALQHVRSVGKLYSHLHKLLRAHGDTSIFLYSVGFYYEDFVWAVSAVMSRQNEIPREKDAKQSVLALIPLWDMCNHWLGTISTDFNVDLRTCDCFSPSAVKPGKELRIFYGARSNAELFLHQGFVYPPNTGDTLRIKLGLSSGEDAATKAMKAKLLTILDIPLSGVFHVLAAEDPFTPQLKAFVRIFTAKKEDLKQYVDMDRETLKTELMADKWSQGDIPVLQFLVQRCELLLKTYRSTMFEDLEKVTQTKLDNKTHQALMLTICERCILGSAVKVAVSHRATLESREGQEEDGGMNGREGGSLEEGEEGGEEEEGEEEEEEEGEGKVAGGGAERVDILSECSQAVGLAAGLGLLCGAEEVSEVNGTGGEEEEGEGKVAGGGAERVDILSECSQAVGLAAGLGLLCGAEEVLEVNSTGGGEEEEKGRREVEEEGRTEVEGDGERGFIGTCAEKNGCSEREAGMDRQGEGREDSVKVGDGRREGEGEVEEEWTDGGSKDGEREENGARESEEDQEREKQNFKDNLEAKDSNESEEPPLSAHEELADTDKEVDLTGKG